MARAVKKLSTPSELDCAKLCVEFMSENEKGDTPNKTGTSTLSRWATDIVMVSGEAPSYVFFAVPQLALEEIAGQVAMSYTSTPKLFTRARVYFVEDNKKIPLLVGLVTRYQHDVKSDSVVGTICDDRMLLSKVTCFGKVRFNPMADEEEQSAWLDDSSPLEFEPLSCVDTPMGPLFAPSHKFGHSFNGTTVMPDVGDAKKAARNWRCVDVWNYLRNVYGTSEFAGLSFDGYGNIKMSKNIIWDDGLCDAINWQRWANGLVLENDSLLVAMQKVCRQSGPYSVYMEPSDWKGTIRVTDMSGRKSTATLYMPRYYPDKSIGDFISDPNCIMSGNLVENAASYFHGAVILGDPPTIERVVDAKQGTELAQPSILRYGWSSEDEDAFRAYVTANGDSKTAFLAACDIFPNVFALYFVDPAKGTIFPDGSAYVGNEPHWNAKIRASLLSSKTMATDAATYNQNNSGYNPADWYPLEIPVEVNKGTDEEPEWEMTDKLDGLSISSDRTMIYIDGLRRRGSEHITWKVNEGDGPYLGESMAPRNVRMTLAIEGEKRIIKQNRTDPNKTSSRVRNDEEYDWLVVAEKGDYVHWERWHSYPYGQQIDESRTDLEFSDKIGANPLFSDLTRMEGHVAARIRDVKRISYSGELVTARMNPALKPGMSVDIRGSVLEDGDNGGAIIESWSFSALDQQQVIQLASDDRQRIYDVPTGAAANYIAPTPPSNSDSMSDSANANPSKKQSLSTSGGSTMTPDQQAKWNKAMEAYKSI